MKGILGGRRWLVPLWLMGVLLLSACSAPATPSQAHAVAMADMSTMPAEVQAAPAVVQQAYQFAIANPDVVEQLPCYCGCGKVGHKSNYACYVSGTDATRGIQFDSHALGCSICVDITLDAMRLTREGKDIQHIRAYVDETYAQFGPSNMAAP